MAAQKRIYIGGLIPEITSSDVEGRFQPFGEVLACEIVKSKAAGSDPNSCRGFAYVTLQPKDEASLARMLSLYNGCKWRGQKLRVELAKPDYLAKLKQEWQADQELEQAAQQQQQDQEKQQQLEKQEKQQAGPGDEEEDAHILRLTVPGTKKKTINVDLTAKSKSHRSWFPTHKMKRPHELDWEPLPPSKRAALQAAAEAAPPLQRAGAEQLQSFLERQQRIEALIRKQQQQQQQPADGPGAQGVAVPFSYTDTQQQQPQQQQQQPAKKGLSQVVQQELWSQLKLLKRISEREQQQHGHKNQAVVEFLDVGSIPGQQHGSVTAADDAVEAADGLLDTVLSRFDDSDSDGEGREIPLQEGLLVAAARVSKPVPQAAAASSPVVPAVLPAGNQTRLLNKQQQQQVSKQPKVQQGQQQTQGKQPSKGQQPQQQRSSQHPVPKLPEQGRADSEGSSEMSSDLTASDDGDDSEYGSDQWEQWLAAEGIMAAEDSSDGPAATPPPPADAAGGSGAGGADRAKGKAGVPAAAAATASARPSRGVGSDSGGQPAGGSRQQLSSSSKGRSSADATSSDGSEGDKGSLPQQQLPLKQQQPLQQRRQTPLQGTLLKQQQGGPKHTKQNMPQVARAAGKQAARAPPAAAAAFRGLDAFDSDSEEVLVDVDDDEDDGAAAAVHSKQQRGQKHSGDMLLCPMMKSGRRGV